MRLFLLMGMLLGSGLAAWAQGAGGASLPVEQLLTFSGKQAGWRGLYAGKSHLEDVKRVLGEPASAEEEPDGTMRHVYAPAEAIKFNSVYVDGAGVVTTIGWGLFEPTVVLTGRDLWRLLGEPVVLSPTSSEPGAAVYRWPDAGVWGVVSVDRRSVHSLVFHPPAQAPKFQRAVEPVQ